MKKAFLLFLTLALICSLACADAVRVAALKGPTAMGMVKMMSDDEQTGNYEFSIFASADELTPLLVQGRLDIASVPANLAAVLFARTNGAVRVLNINTLGVLYIAERGDSVRSVSDLAGRTIYSAGKGSTPEFALNYILSANGLTPGKDVTVEYKSEHAECLAAIMADPRALAMLPQPFLTTAASKAEDLRAALDLTREWDALRSGSAMITGVCIARSAFIEENPLSVGQFMSDYADSVEYVSGNTAGAAQLVGAYDIVPAAVAEKALPQCNICFISDAEMKDKLSGYLAVLCEADPASVGGTLPGDDFYYVTED